MNKLSRTLVALFAAAGFSAAIASPSQSQEVSYFDDSSFVSTKTRAEVQAPAIGFNPSGEVSYFADATGPSKARAQVVAEAREAARLGVIASGQIGATTTPAQAEQIRMAGLQAIGEPSVARAN